jgi:putative hydrolase of the HAD superfamily
MSLKGLIFDFDGLILDTEVPGFLAWQEIFSAYGLPFTYSHWAKAIGTGPSAYDPAEDLRSQLGIPLDVAQIREVQLERAHEILRDVPIQPGVLEFILTAKQRKLKLAVASSSPRNWVINHLNRLDLVKYFDTILTAEDVMAVKPDPELFNLALKHLDLNSHEAVVFEDSPNGITAARSAGIYVVAVPNEITKTLDTSHANMHFSTFTEIKIEQLIDLFNNA